MMSPVPIALVCNMGSVEDVLIGPTASYQKVGNMLIQTSLHLTRMAETYFRNKKSSYWSQVGYMLFPDQPVLQFRQSSAPQQSLQGKPSEKSVFRTLSKGRGGSTGIQGVTNNLVFEYYSNSWTEQQYSYLVFGFWGPRQYLGIRIVGLNT